MRHTSVQKLHSATSVGYAEGGAFRERLGYLGSGPKTVITDLTALNTGATVDQAKETVGWDLKVADDSDQTDPPTERELSVLRELHARTEAARR